MAHCGKQEIIYLLHDGCCRWNRKQTPFFRFFLFEKISPNGGLKLIMGHGGRGAFIPSPDGRQKRAGPLEIFQKNLEKTNHTTIHPSPSFNVRKKFEEKQVETRQGMH